MSFRLDPSCCNHPDLTPQARRKRRSRRDELRDEPGFLELVSLTARLDVYRAPRSTGLGSVGAMTATVYDVPADVTGPISFGTPVGVNLPVPGQTRASPSTA